MCLLVESASAWPVNVRCLESLEKVVAFAPKLRGVVHVIESETRCTTLAS